MTEGTKFRRVVVEERSVRHRCKTYDGFAACAAGAFLCIIMRDEEEVVLCYTLYIKDDRYTFNIVSLSVGS